MVLNNSIILLTIEITEQNIEEYQLTNFYKLAIVETSWKYWDTNDRTTRVTRSIQVATKGFASIGVGSAIKKINKKYNRIIEPKQKSIKS